MRAVFGLLFLAVLPPCLDAAQQTAVQALALKKNPIRKVVNMLRNMVKKVEEEGKREEELFEKFMCSCKTDKAGLSKSISDAETKVPQLASTIEEGESKKKQLDEDITKHKADRSAAKEAMSKATALREKQAAAYAKDAGENKANLAATSKAITALEKGMGGAFLQSSSANVLQRLVQDRESMQEADRMVLTAFLTESTGLIAGENAPSSGEIVGILKTMKDEMSTEIANAEAAEKAAITSYDELMSAKTKEVKALGKALEDKISRVGDLAVGIVQQKGDLSDTQDALAADKKFLANLEKSCATKEAENDELQKTRSEELVALADTIKILNDDDALDLFKKTLPSASASSFLQVDRSERLLLSKARRAILAVNAPKRTVHLDFIALAMHGKKVGFDSIIKKIDGMTVVLKKEQKDDDEKKEYCAKQFDEADDKKKAIERSISDLKTVIANAEDGISGLQEEIKAVGESIKALDASVAKATEQRKQEHSDFTETMSSDSAAKDILKFAKTRLNKFYNPKLALMQKKSQRSDYKKKAEESNGVIAMIDTLVADLEKELTVAKTEEKDAQSDYEQLMKDSQDKRAGDAKNLAAKEATLADLKASLEATHGQKSSATKELATQVQYIGSLHSDCDWLLSNFDVRKEARESEMDALSKAKAVLNGADYSLVQTSARTSLRGDTTFPAHSAGNTRPRHHDQPREQEDSEDSLVQISARTSLRGDTTFPAHSAGNTRPVRPKPREQEEDSEDSLVQKSARTSLRGDTTFPAHSAGNTRPKPR